MPQVERCPWCGDPLKHVPADPNRRLSAYYWHMRKSPDGRQILPCPMNARLISPEHVAMMHDTESRDRTRLREVGPLVQAAIDVDTMMSVDFSVDAYREHAEPAIAKLVEWLEESAKGASDD